MTDQNRDTPVIPEPTDFATAREDGVADRIASADTEGGSDQFTPSDETHSSTDERRTSDGEVSSL